MTPQMIMVMVIGGGFTLLLLAASFWGDDGISRKRLARARGVPLQATPQNTPTINTLRRKREDSSIPLLDKIIKGTLPNPEKLRGRLGSTGKNLTLGEYLIFSVLLGAGGFIVFGYLLHWNRLASFFGGLGIGVYIPHMIVGMLIDKRIRKFLDNFPEAIDTICRGLRSGLPITESIRSVGNEMPDPIGVEFRRISDGVRLGQPLDDAMWDVAKRLTTPEFRFFIIALAIQRETGGNLAETLGNLADLLRKRRQLKQKVRAMSSEAKASAMIIGSLPFLMFALLFVVSPDYVKILLTDPRGQTMLGAGALWMGIGIFVMKKMISFEL